MISANVILPTEISFGTSTTIKTGAEYPFNGYIKEFRWWKQPRDKFQFLNFMNIALTKINNFSPPNTLLAYWKLDEDRKLDTVFHDFASGGTVTYDPMVANISMPSLIEMREIFLIFCPEGTYSEMNLTLGYYQCSPCNSACGNCNGPTDQDCTSCISPYKLLETQEQCIITASCP